MRAGVAIAVALGATLFSAASPAAPADPGIWSERVQIIYRAESRSVERRLIKVWDPWPEKNLDFVWEPEGNAVLAADGTVGGRGKLVWRVRGSASYDPKTVFATYSGSMMDGRPHGEGRLELRSGEIFDGHWSGGGFTGAGFHVDAGGNRFEGMFANGKLNGAGRQTKPTGEIFEGSFVAGLRHGKGRTRLPGGTIYDSSWDMGRDLEGRPAEALADATVGGLLKAQAGGGDAGKVEIGVSVDQRMNSQSDMKYTHLVRDEDIAIYPEDQAMNDAWNGAREITASSYTFEGIDWEDAPAFVGVALATTDGTRVKLGKLELQVETSDAYRKPMLSVLPHFGCVGFRPSFSLLNYGWGQVLEPTMSLQFTGPEPGGPASRAFSVGLEGFDEGTDVVVGNALAEAGVALAQLQGQRFSCPSFDDLSTCRAKLLDEIDFGEIADYVWGEDRLYTTVVGTLDYSWADDYGQVFQQSEPFRTEITLATIELPPQDAEGGDGVGGAPEALRFQDVVFPLGKSGFTIDMPLRGNRNISKYTARLKMRSQMSSYHRFSVAATLGDGSIRQSKPVSFYHFRPRKSTFESQVQTGECYLVEEPEFR